MRSFVAGLAIFLAFLTGTAALGAFVAHQVLLDPDRAGQALDAALSDPTLSDRVLDAVVPGVSGLPTGVRTAVRRAALDPTVHRLARQVTFDPRTGEISLKAIQDEVLPQISRFGLGAAATNTGDAVIMVPAKDLKRYNDARDRTAQVALLGGVVTAVLVLVALLASKRRLQTLRALGIWTLVSCALVAAAYWLLPTFIDAASSSIAAQAAAVVAAASRSAELLVIAPFAVAGAALIVVSFVVPHRPTA